MPGAAPYLNHSITRAGAGAGKTTGLVNRVIEVYRDARTRGETPRIVLTTFTRKATQELKERLIARACIDEDPGLLQFVSDPARLQIATIHGLLNVFLRQVGHLAGVDAGFQIVGEGEARHLARLALRAVILERGVGANWLETYGFPRTLDMCRAFATQLAEHGTLRPATLAEIENAAEVEVTYWRGKLKNLSDEILGAVEDASLQKYARVLEEFATGWSGDCEDIAVPRKPPSSKKKPELDQWHDLITREIKAFKKEMERPCWARAPWPRAAAAWAEFTELGRAFATELSARKNQAARFEMNDLELKTTEILRARPYLGEIFAEAWDYWMIDEYQDTSPAQVACLRALIGDRPKYYVGDPQQSIYLFRGAEVRVFDHAEDMVRGLGGQTHELLRNWRSRPELLEFMNAFMADLGGNKFRAMEPRATVDPGAPPCARLIDAEEPERELDAVVARVGELLESGAKLDQICILGRTHQRLMAVSRALKDFAYPTHVHSARGFETRREVIDARAFWKFLIDPHDNANLVLLLRSPWFNVPDARLVEWMSARPESLWRALEDAVVTDDAVARLRSGRARVEQVGLTRAFEAGLVDNFYLDLSLVNDPAGRKESNLWKLILQARALEKEGGRPALDLLGADTLESALDAAEGDAASAQEPNCINLMTIHGAKGLQFEHVIVPGLGDAPRAPKVPSFAADAGVFHFPTWDDAENQSVPTPLDHLAAREKGGREREEFDRQIYVAITRAKESLTLTWSKPALDSWAGRSRFAQATAGLHREALFAFEKSVGAGTPVRFGGAPALPTAPRAPWGQITPAAEERLSVTDLIGANSEDLMRGDPEQLLARWGAQTAGTRVHRALEAMRYGAEAPEFAREITFIRGLKDPPIEALLKKGEVEWGFQVRLGPHVIEGQIDLWGMHDGWLHVVDYKSGSPEFVETAFAQLETYAWALGRFGHRGRTRLSVIYPRAGRVVSRECTDQSLARRELELGRS